MAAIDDANQAFARRDYAAVLRLLEDQPSSDALHLRGLVAHRLGRLDEAHALITQALTIEDVPQWRANLGLVCLDQRRPEDAVRHLQQATLDDPEDADAHNNLAAALLATGQPQAAIASAAIAIDLGAEEPATAYNNFGAALQMQGRLTDARYAMQAARDLEPGVDLYALNLAFLDLLEGHTVRGWMHHERRGMPRRRPRRWQGEPLDGRPLLLIGEQGLGDILQFCRYAPMLAAQGAEIWLEVRPKLWPLLRSLSPPVRLVNEEQGAHAGWSVPLMSLPYLLGPREEDYPRTVPYLHATPEQVAQWAPRLPNGPRRIGLCWQGNPNSDADLGRSFPLATVMKHLGGIADVTWISIQRGAGEEQLADAPQVHRLPGLDVGAAAFLDTAAVIAQLDMVISADTSVAHLSAALGCPTWIVLRHIPDWRWGIGRDTSPWYPTVRLFRQPAYGDWDTPLQQIRAALTQP